MGRVNFNDAQESSSNNEFFKLDDGGVARLQFLISNVEDIPTFYAHHVEPNGYQWGKDVQCNMDDYEDGECALCQAGIQRKTVAVILMYDHNDKKVKIWQRSKKWVSDKIVPLLNRYDLKNTVVEIERKGSKLDTSYTLFAMPQIEPLNVDNVEVPDNFDFMLWNKTNEDMITYLNTGEFPATEENGGNDGSPMQRRLRNEEPQQITRRGSQPTPSRRGGRF